MHLIRPILHTYSNHGGKPWIWERKPMAVAEAVLCIHRSTGWTGLFWRSWALLGWKSVHHEVSREEGSFRVGQCFWLVWRSVHPYANATYLWVCAQFWTIRNITRLRAFKHGSNGDLEGEGGGLPNILCYKIQDQMQLLFKIQMYIILWIVFYALVCYAVPFLGGYASIPVILGGVFKCLIWYLFFSRGQGFPFICLGGRGAESGREGNHYIQFLTILKIWQYFLDTTLKDWIILLLELEI